MKSPLRGQRGFRSLAPIRWVRGGGAYPSIRRKVNSPGAEAIPQRPRAREKERSDALQNDFATSHRAQERNHRTLILQFGPAQPA